MKIPLGRPYIKKKIVLKEIGKVLDRKWLSGGPAIQEFEDAVKKYNNDEKGYYIAVANATVGLELALRSLLRYNETRFSPENEIIVPSWSWVASAFAIKNVGAKPVWCDVNSNGVITVDHIERLRTPNTRAIVVVHQMGIPCDMDRINSFAHRYGIPVIEDAACAFGSEYKGKKIGVSENTVVYSFQARKCLTTGEGGMIVTPNAYTASWLRSMRAFGTTVSPLERDSANFLLKETFDKIGTNYKISDLQCALGLAHLKYFDEEIEMRTKAANLYTKIIEERFPSFDVQPAINKYNMPSYCTKYNWQNYHILLSTKYNRDKIVDLMRKRDIGCKWDIQAIHLEPSIDNKGTILSITENFHNHGLWLPFFAEITLQEQIHVIDKGLVEILKLNEVRV